MQVRLKSDGLGQEKVMVQYATPSADMFSLGKAKSIPFNT
jgi:hypothetical protein